MQKQVPKSRNTKKTAPKSKAPDVRPQEEMKLRLDVALYLLVSFLVSFGMFMFFFAILTAFLPAFGLEFYAVILALMFIADIFGFVAGMALLGSVMRKHKMRERQEYYEVKSYAKIIQSILELFITALIFLGGLLPYLVQSLPIQFFQAILIYLVVKMVVKLLCFFLSQRLKENALVAFCIVAAFAFLVFWGVSILTLNVIGG